MLLGEQQYYKKLANSRYFCLVLQKYLHKLAVAKK
jgi:hypothetical protein